MTKKIKKEMQIFLKENVPNLGRKGNLINVKSGYVRNYLIPMKFAELATPTLIEKFKVQQKQLKQDQEQFIINAKNNKKILDTINEFIIKKRVTKQKRIFGKIRSTEILTLILNQTGINLRESDIVVPEITELGIYNITVNLHSTISTNVQIKIVSE
uniref:Large ribosomal subunit protein bL9c n=1 Tax=Schizocladia ischiensis TaxID=196139 RepID=A0A7S6ZPC1_9STRA|nr:ribosomal protein L9 [Schizocladia ischiensis]QOW07577.1 ribosomal protein L9 [Schizocladia ischiensis]